MWQTSDGTKQSTRRGDGWDQKIYPSLAKNMQTDHELICFLYKCFFVLFTIDLSEDFSIIYIFLSLREKLTRFSYQSISYHKFITLITNIANRLQYSVKSTFTQLFKNGEVKV